MADLVSTVLSIFKADTSDIKAKVKDLSGAEKKLAQERLAGIEASNKSLDGYVKALAKVGAALVVLKVGFDGANLAIEEQRLRAGAGAISVEKLTKAFDGQLTRIDELRAAQKLHASAMRFTADDTLNLARAVRGLARDGYDAKQVTDEITQALSTGGVDALTKYGVAVDTSALRYDKFGHVLNETQRKAAMAHEALAKLVALHGRFDNAQETTAEKMTRTQNDIHNSVDNLKEAFGNLVIQLQPAIAALAKVVNEIAKITGYVMDASKANSGSFLRKFALGGFGVGLDVATTELQNQIDDATGKNFLAHLLKAGGVVGLVQEKKLQEIVDKQIAYLDKIGKKYDISGQTKLTPEQEKERQQRLADEAIFQREGLAGLIGDFNLGPALPLGAVPFSDARSADIHHFGVTGLTGTGISAPGADELDSIEAAMAELQDKARIEKKESFLESVFGKPEEFNAYKELFDGLTNGVSSAYEAIVTGSEPAGKAFKHAIAEQMLAIGKSEAVLAIKEAAWALGDLAIGNIPGASAHGLSALQHAAAAAAAGVVAHELGAGGSSGPAKGSSGSTGTGATGGSTGTATPQQPRQAVIVIGESFDESTPRQRQLKAEQLVKRALGNSGVEDS